MSKICLNTNYTRSINIERDFDSISLVNAYIPTNRTISTLHQISSTIFVEGSPKAWALIGPYGSGKSAFAIYLSSILGNKNKEIKKKSIKLLKKEDSKLVSVFKNKNLTDLGFVTITITGSPEPLSKRILEALGAKLNQLWSQSNNKPGILNDIDDFLESERDLTSTEILKIFRETNSKLKKEGYFGLLLIIDELGNF